MLDVRTKEEFEEGSIEQAINVDFFSDNFLSELKSYNKSKYYLVYCRSGIRSLKSCELMIDELGFSNLYNLEGGYINL